MPKNTKNPTGAANANRTIELTPLLLAGRAKPESYNADKRTIEVGWGKGARVLRWSWEIGYYYEELDMSPEAVSMSRLQSGKAPVLDTHSGYRLANVIGVVEAARLQDGEGIATLRFSGREDLAGIIQDIQDGIIANVSVGYEVRAMELVEKSEGDYPVYRVTEWEPYELSMVPVPADAEAGTRSAGKKTNPCHINGATAQDNEGETAMPKDNENRAAANAGADEGNKGGEGSNTAAITAAAGDATVAERSRVADITALCRKHGVTDEDMQKYITDGTTADKVRSTILDSLAAAGEQTNSRSQHTGAAAVGDNSPQNPATRMAAMQSAILHRVNPDHKLEGMATEFRGFTLFEMSRDYVDNVMRVNTRGMDRSRVIALALGHRGEARGATHTTSDFANVLGGVVNTQLREAYSAVSTSYADIVNRMTAVDYRPINMVDLGNAPKLLKVNEAGEYEYGTIGDSGETIRVAKYGRIIRVTEEVIINDSLDVFSKLPRKFGEEAALLISEMVWLAIASNPTMSDGKALFHADHGNLLTGSDSVLDPESVTALTEARKMLRSQTYAGEDRKLNRTLGTLLAPISLETVAEQLIYPINPVTSDGVNPFARKTKLAIEGTLENVPNGDKMWYGIAEGVRPVDLLMLEGYQNGPSVQTRNGWEMDSVEIKVKTAAAAKPSTYVGIMRGNGQ